ncbi:MFS transporter [Eikenella sp. S3360]|uniref:MFS transporter n=1 Tax=Eikenella glucosivorans TaxID=2766967 RepID=A0ABS0N9I1_9NEIS|nr:hypothetical protein [Eikenella glucosivorans]MBH5328950.1 MFS transporter [Eikenella glucosivorans]
MPAPSANLSANLSARLRQMLNVRPGEGRPLLLAALYVVSLFLAYYVLRPIRDELGAAGGVEKLPWLFAGTLAAMLLLSPLYAALVRRLPRERFIAAAYRFFMLNLLAFAALMYWGSVAVWTGRAFFIWVSVFNLFVVSVFWSLMADVFDTEQGTRLFGLLAAGATAGGLLGSALVSALSGAAGPYALLLLAAVFLETAVQAAKRLARPSDNTPSQTQRLPENEIGGGIWAGLTHTLKSPYLLGISAFILLYTVTSTLLYFNQAAIVNANFASRAERTAFFANIDLWVNALTLLCQLFLTGRLTQKLGITAVLAVLPLMSLAGFAALAAFPTVAVFVVLQVARRVGNFAFARPSREVLFTRLSREDRYKAKNFIDTVVYRAGDQLGGWGYAALGAAGLGISAVSWAAVPLCAAWLAIALWLGKRARGA